MLIKSTEGARDLRELCKYGYDHQAKRQQCVSWPSSTSNPRTNKQVISLIRGNWAYPVWTGHRGPCLTRFGSGGKIKSYRHHYEERKAINLMGGFFYSSEQISTLCTRHTLLYWSLGGSFLCTPQSLSAIKVFYNFWPFEHFHPFVK